MPKTQHTLQCTAAPTVAARPQAGAPQHGQRHEGGGARCMNEYLSTPMAGCKRGRTYANAARVRECARGSRPATPALLPALLPAILPAVLPVRLRYEQHRTMRRRKGSRAAAQHALALVYARESKRDPYRVHDNEHHEPNEGVAKDKVQDLKQPPVHWAELPPTHAL